MNSLIKGKSTSVVAKYFNVIKLGYFFFKI